tara:strand:+ start:317 stop:529 length:213 start_codon:yes stop_codon:yes gene_type:complete
MMIFNYESKKEMKENIGQQLKYTETSMFGPEFKTNGAFAGCNRPTLPQGTGKREFFAEVTMQNGLIYKVK